jgi:hypothetical protein
MKGPKALILTAVLLCLGSSQACLHVSIASDLQPRKPEFKTREEFATYRNAAWAHYRKRCTENARETVNRVVENVDSLFLIRPRQRPSEEDLADQSWMGDPYGYSSYEVNHPAATYLFDRSGKTISGQSLTPIKGFKYVECRTRVAREQSAEATIFGTSWLA